MCGIFGQLGAPLPPAALRTISAALAHRGPDAEGHWRDDACTLIHRRLKIIDLSDAAAQPMGSEDGGVQVVFNGEIYNHRALRRELEGAGHTFRSRADTEVIVHGYEAWGDDVVTRLDGMFAFGLWDRRRRRLLLSCDRAGKKPLFYAAAGGVFRFGSTISTLHAAGLRREVAVETLPFYLAYGFVPPPRSSYADVLQLPPAHRLVLEEGRAPRVEAYWAPEFGARPVGAGFAEAAATVRRLVSEAVERRLEADVPLGAFLSGGIDSTIVVGLMARRLDRPVRTFSIGFSGDARYDETSYARVAARAFGTEHTEFTLEPSSMELVETLVTAYEGPFGDSSAIPTYVVSKLTREHVTVALTGDGGDELFCGYQRFLAADGAERIPFAVRRFASLAGRALLRPRRERSLAGRVARFLDASQLPLADRMARWNSFFPDPTRILRGDVAQELGRALDAPLDWQREVFAGARGRSALARVLEHNFKTYLPFDLLVKADRTSMAHGLELRSPFLDTALIEYAASLPPAYLRRGLTTKRILRAAFRDLLPPQILGRGKMGFGVPLGTWFRENLRAFVRDRLGPGACLFDYLDRRAVLGLLDAHDRGQADHGQRIWALLTLEIWLRGLGSVAAPMEQVG